MTDYLTSILARTRRENLRRRRHVKALRPREREPEPIRGRQALDALRRPTGRPPRVIAEVKFRSPSAGEIRPRGPGEGVRVAGSYERGGAAAISVLADAPGFAGSPLEVRRVSEAVSVPVLFKGFVIDPVQVDLAFDVGASMVLLLVRAIRPAVLRDLVGRTRSLGMEPVVEAADRSEVEQALRAEATIVGVNARDLETFVVDADLAHDCIERIPADRVAVFMSGIREEADLQRTAQGRADAVLIGEGLMRADDPGARLAALLASV